MEVFNAIASLPAQPLPRVFGWMSQGTFSPDVIPTHTWSRFHTRPGYLPALLVSLGVVASVFKCVAASTVAVRHDLQKQHHPPTPGAVFLPPLTVQLSIPSSVLHPTTDGYLWVGTTGGISVRSPAGEWQSITMDDGLAGNRVTAIATDPADPRRHWFATNGGASLLDDGNTPLDKRDNQWMTFGKRDGILNNHLSAVTLAPDDVWFGLTYVDAEIRVRVGNGISVLRTNGTPFDKVMIEWSSSTRPTVRSPPMSSINWLQMKAASSG